MSSQRDPVSVLAQAALDAVQSRRSTVDQERISLEDGYKALSSLHDEAKASISKANVSLDGDTPTPYLPTAFFTERGQNLQTQTSYEKAKEALKTKLTALKRDVEMIDRFKWTVQQRPMIASLLEQIQYTGGLLTCPVCWLSIDNRVDDGTRNISLLCFPECYETKLGPSSGQGSQGQAEAPQSRYLRIGTVKQEFNRDGTGEWKPGSVNTSSADQSSRNQKWAQQTWAVIDTLPQTWHSANVQ